jgi:hypothetical protein
MKFVLFPIRIYQTAIGLLFIGLLITFFHRAEYYDEAWFAEQSFWLIRDGQVRSELFRGYNGWENGIYVFHKLFVYAGALIMSITGVTVSTSKLVSILFGLICGYLVWLYGRNTSREQQWLSILLYFGCGTLIRYISVNRPETMCMALGFASYLALDPDPRNFISTQANTCRYLSRIIGVDAPERYNLFDSWSNLAFCQTGLAFNFLVYCSGGFNAKFIWIGRASRRKFRTIGKAVFQ